jgi:hypothetical protein
MKTLTIIAAGEELTPMQAAVLRAWPLNYDAPEYEKGDNATWTDVADMAKATGLNRKQVRSVMGSLEKRGLIECGHEAPNGAPGEQQILKPRGIDVSYALHVAQAEQDAVAYQTSPLNPAYVVGSGVVEGFEQEADAALADEQPEQPEAKPALGLLLWSNKDGSWTLYCAGRKVFRGERDACDTFCAGWFGSDDRKLWTMLKTGYTK